MTWLGKVFGALADRWTDAVVVRLPADDGTAASQNGSVEAAEASREGEERRRDRDYLVLISGCC